MMMMYVCELIQHTEDMLVQGKVKKENSLLLKRFLSLHSHVLPLGAICDPATAIFFAPNLNACRGHMEYPCYVNFEKRQSEVNMFI